MKPPQAAWAELKHPRDESVAWFIVSYQDGIVEMVRNDRGDVRVYRSRLAAMQAADLLKVPKPGVVGMSAEGYERFRREQTYAVEE